MTGHPYDNANAHRAYPFIEDEQLGILNNDVVLDARLLVYAAFGAPATIPLTLESIAVNGGGTAMTVTMQYGSAALVLVVSAAATDQYYETSAVDGNGNLTIMLRMMFGPGAAGFCADHAGTAIAFSSPEIEPSCVAVYDKHRVTGVAGSYAGSERLTGAIQVQEGYNLGLALVADQNALRITAGLGLGLGIPCEVLHPTTEDCEKFVYFLNGMHPDWFGEFKLMAGPGIAIQALPAANKLVISTTVDRCRPKCRDDKEG